MFHAAKMLEQAVLLCRDMGYLNRISGYAERGALLYRQGKIQYPFKKMGMGGILMVVY